MKVVIVGAVAAGATCATNIRRLSEDVDIVMFEKDRDMSFSNCQIPYFLSDTFEESASLVGNDSESFRKKYNIEGKSCHEVVSIDRKNKKVLVKNISDDTTFYETYDKLVLAPGASSVIPNIKGNDLKHVFSLRNVEDIEKIKAYVLNNDVKNLSVIGAGFIGIEACENIVKHVKNVNLIDSSDEVLTNIDSELKGIIEKNLMENGVKLYKKKTVTEIGEDYILFEDGLKVDSDMVIFAVGMRGNIKLAKEAGLEVNEKTSSIVVDKNYQTSDKDIYAAGDVIEVFNMISREKTKLQLAWPAHRQAKHIANHILGFNSRYTSVVGSFILRSFDINIASCGLNEKTLKENDMIYESSITTSLDRSSLIPTKNTITTKLLFDPFTGLLYGAQIVGKGVVDKRCDVCAVALKHHLTVYDLEALELCYNPLYSTPEDAINVAANQAVNVIDKSLRYLKLKDFDLKKDEFLVIDLRDEKSYKEDHIENAINIKYADFRKRMNEIPKDKKVLFYDFNGALSSNALKTLNNFGYQNTYILEGGKYLFDLYKQI